MRMLQIMKESIHYACMAAHLHFVYAAKDALTSTEVEDNARRYVHNVALIWTFAHKIYTSNMFTLRQTCLSRSLENKRCVWIQNAVPLTPLCTLTS